eukprot:Gb_09367 [translate_table: standard]
MQKNMHAWDICGRAASTAHIVKVCWVACKWICMHVTYACERHLQHICDVRQPLEKVIQMDSTARSKEKAHGKVKLEPYSMSLKKVLIVPNEGGVPMEDVKHQQGVQIKREYIIPYTSQKGEVAKKPNSQH